MYHYPVKVIRFAVSRFAVAAAALVLCAAPLAAHPHMFLESRAEIVTRGGSLSGVWLEWKLDTFFSADLIHGYDLNRDGIFDAAETRALEQGAFANLRHYHYFTFIRVGTVRTNPSAVKDFSARQSGGAVIYRFFVDLSAYAADELYLAVYDYTYFCDIRYPQRDPVSITDGAQVPGRTLRWEIVENREYPVYYNPLGAVDDTTGYYKPAPGLATYYPREIRIFGDAR